MLDYNLVYIGSMKKFDDILFERRLLMIKKTIIRESYEIL